MATVRTVLGDIDAAQLGMTDAHEHLILIGGLPVMREPEFRLDDVDRTISEVCAFLAAGGRALLDAMPLGCGRSAERLVRVARETGAHIIAATGFHQESFYDDLHWIHRYDVDQLTQLLVGELTDGMDEYGYNGPFPRLVPARAGAIKVATGYQTISPTARKLCEAAVAAQRATGAPIFTHTEHGTMGLEQAELLLSLGADPASVIIGHLDRNPDLAYHHEIGALGVFLQYDTPGRIKYQPESVVIDLIAGMVDAGFGGQVLLGGDLARRSSWAAYGGGPGMAYLPARFLPRLRAHGIPGPAVDALMIDNPARALSLGHVRA